jgi:hypothetical protein
MSSLRQAVVWEIVSLYLALWQVPKKLKRYPERY